MGSYENEMRQLITNINKKMTRDQLEQHIIEFIKAHNVCVLSTSK